MKLIKKEDYLHDALTTRKYASKKWLIRVLSIIRVLDEPDEDPAYIPSENKVLYSIGGILCEIIDAKKDIALFGINESLLAQPEMLANIPEPIETTYREALLNAIILAEPFGNKVPFMTGDIDGKRLDGVVDTLLREEKISIEEYHRFMKCMGFITFLTDFCVTPTSKTALRPSKKVFALRDKLLKENEGKLHDPVVVAEIDRQIVEALKEELKGDPAEGFFIKNKSIATARKMTHGIIGGVPRLDDDTKVEIIPRSLEEGWRAEDMIAANNNSRSGSYDRGKDTALGGEAAKLSGRMYQNTKITMPDCESKIGLPVFIDKANYKEFTGRYLTNSDKTPLTEEGLKKLIGTNVFIRSPLGCKVKGGNYCEKCLGDTVAKSGVGLGPQASQVGSVFLSISLAAFHGKQLRTTKYDFNKVIT